VYVHIKRSLAVPLLNVFDAADPDSPCPQRFTTTQPSQALALINGDFANEQAALFAKSVQSAVGDDSRKQVSTVLGRVYQRSPSSAEVERGLKFLEESVRQDGLTKEEALRRFCLVALNLNEFLFLN